MKLRYAVFAFVLVAGNRDYIAEAFVAPTTKCLVSPNKLRLRNSFVDSTARATINERNNGLAVWHSTAESGTPVTEKSEAVAQRRARQKESLLGLLDNPTAASTTTKDKEDGYDPVLADPMTKDPIRITTSGPILGGGSGVKVILRSSPERSDFIYTGRTNTYFNLLEPFESASSTLNNSENENDNNRKRLTKLLKQSVSVFIPPPLRSALGSDDYILMRDLFTNPAVSFAYERGWRQNFAVAGFPGPDKEYEMVKEFFEPATVGVGPTTVVDMSCATGLFTRRLAKSNEYNRVIGCDYSESMLLEARRRIRSDRVLRQSQRQKTRLDLVRCDVGKIPMQTKSVNALHAGAAMHCWPDIKGALREIYRVLKPGGRYFATTFLSDHFRRIGATGISRGGSNTEMAPAQMTFQTFESTDVLRDLLIEAGFEKEKIKIEVLGQSCVVIRCEK